MEQEIAQSSFSPVDDSWTFFSHPSSSSLMLELPCSEVPEQWFPSNMEESKNEYERPPPTNNTTLTSVSADPEPSEVGPVVSDAGEAPARRRRRKPGLRQPRQPSCHVEVERQRREKMNRRFCELRAAVPTVSRMDKSSLLGDAVDYITKLRARVAQLEAELRKAAMARLGVRADGAGAEVDDAVEARMVGAYMAVVRVTSPARHAPASLMVALRSMDLQVRHASVSRVYGMTTMDAAVDVPAHLGGGGGAKLGDDGLRTAILQKMQDGGGPQ